MHIQVSASDKKAIVEFLSLLKNPTFRHPGIFLVESIRIDVQ
jgi:hypothetical protein